MPKRHRYSAKEHRQVEHIKASEEARGNRLHPGRHRYSAKEKRQAEHIMESEEAAGKSEAVPKSIAYATVNKRAKSR